MKKFFRLVSLFEGLSFLLLLFVAVPLKYYMGQPYLVKLLGMPHGILFLVYIFLGVVVAMDEEWDFKTTAMVLVASTVPFATFYVDHKLLRAASKIERQEL